MTSKLTREQLHERARENVKALKMASRQHAFESAREEILADLQLAELALAAMDSEPVAWDYEWASYITCDGPQDYKRVIEREAPPEWAIEEDQARNVIPLYRHAQPAPVVQKIMARLAYLLDEDQFSNIESMVLAAGISPVVPKEATPDSIEILASARRRDCAVFQWDEDQRNAAADSWNACLGAMLQADTLTNEGARQVDELTMWIKRLVRSLKNANPDSKLPREAMDYLTAKGLISVGDILR
ncbi:hypothetical protein ACI2JR_27635 [Klebsiella sp. NPDC088457]